MYKLTLNEAQAKIVVDALDLYARLRCGQVEEIGKVFRWEEAIKSESKLEQFELVDAACRMLKCAMFPELKGNAAYGIAGALSPEKAKIAYDIEQVVRNMLAWEQDPSGASVNVHLNKPYQWSKEPLPKIEK